MVTGADAGTIIDTRPHNVKLYSRPCSWYGWPHENEYRKGTPPGCCIACMGERRVVCLRDLRRADWVQNLHGLLNGEVATSPAPALRYIGQTYRRCRAKSSDMGLAKISSHGKQRNNNSATMARTRTVTKKEEKAADAPLTTKATSGTPYQLDPSQVERAAKALVAHMKKHVEEKDEQAAVKNLADDEDAAEENDQPIFLSISTKKHISESNRLKPTKMSVWASNNT